jgi:hypothetical protein
MGVALTPSQYQPGVGQMRRLARWLGFNGAWARSAFSDLPRLNRGADPHVDQWLVLGGGLGLILSRLDKSERAGRFRRSNELFKLIRRQLKRGHSISVPARLVGDVMQEVAGVADPMTLSSLRQCFTAARGTESRYAEESRTQSGLSAWSLSSRHSRHSDFDNAETQFGEEIFQERFSGLRKTVAAARATGFGELK